LNCIPPWVSPNNITSTNVVVRLVLLYYSWKQNERPQSLTGLEIFGMSILLGVLMIITEVIDDLDGMHARMSGQCSRFGGVLDHLVDAFGIPILGGVVVMALQMDNVCLCITLNLMTVIFNLQLVLYQRSSVFVEPPISGPRGAVTAMVVIWIAGALIGFVGRNEWVTIIFFAIVNFASVFSCSQNIWFYIQRNLENEQKLHEADPIANPDTPVISLLKQVAAFYTTLAVYAALFLYQYPPEGWSFFEGTDMVNVQDGCLDQESKWFTAAAYTCMMVALSTLVNGGMVQNAVMGLPHNNYHVAILVSVIACIVFTILPTRNDDTNFIYALVLWVSILGFMAIAVCDFYYTMGCPCCPPEASKPKEEAKEEGPLTPSQKRDRERCNSDLDVTNFKLEEVEEPQEKDLTIVMEEEAPTEQAPTK